MIEDKAKNLNDEQIKSLTKNNIDAFLKNHMIYSSIEVDNEE